MKKQTILLVIIGLLLLINLGQLTRPFWNSATSNRDRFDTKVAKDLNLNETQKAQFSQYASAHKKQIDNIQKEQKEVISLYFKVPNDTLLNTITRLESEKIKLTEQHFSDIKSILKPAQISDFEELKSTVLNQILQKEPVKPNRPKK
jgi:protein CpxP